MSTAERVKACLELNARKFEDEDEGLAEPFHPAAFFTLFGSGQTGDPTDEVDAGNALPVTFQRWPSHAQFLFEDGSLLHLEKPWTKCEIW